MWDGDPNLSLAESVITPVYAELQRLARGYLSRERGGHTLQPTALVHETYLRLLDQDQLDWQNRPQLIGIAARLMRRVLVDHARAKATAKRTPETETVRVEWLSETQLAHWIDLEGALDKLESLDPQLVRVVELKFFGGFSIEETAVLMQIGSASVKRLWALARSWLYQELAG